MIREGTILVKPGLKIDRYNNAVVLSKYGADCTKFKEFQEAKANKVEIA